MKRILVSTDSLSLFLTPEEMRKSQISPRPPLSPQARRIRGFQPMGIDQSQACQDDPVCLPRLLGAPGSLPGLSSEGAEKNRRKVHSLTPDKLSNDLSPRNEALTPSSVSPKLVEKQQYALNLENGWFNDRSSKDELPQEETERKDTSGEEIDRPFWWNGDDDDCDDDNGEKVEGGRDQKRKVHSLEEIKYTRYLRMKSPEHWLPKMGKLPEKLLSSYIIIGHTKVPYESIIADDEGKDEDAFEDRVKQTKTAKNEENEFNN